MTAEVRVAPTTDEFWIWLSMLMVKLVSFSGHCLLSYFVRATLHLIMLHNIDKITQKYQKSENIAPCKFIERINNNVV